MDLGLEDTAALTLASSGGLGKGAATALAREGADVVINGRTEASLEETREEIEDVATGDVVAVRGDITDPDTPADLVETTVDEFGRLDHLVTSAGGPPRLQFLETEDEHWNDAWELLVMPVVRTVRAAAPHLEADGGGSVVAITSKIIKEASSANVLSSSVRMTVAGIQKVLSEQLAPEIRANTIMPGAYESPRVYNGFDRLIEAGEIADYDEGRERRAEDIPVDRMGDPIELGDTVAYLCSDRAGYTNGDAIFVDGGSHASTL
jgi:NAD(P)-dependent dehydrogenase (short-subunit alcohol dehydrogenase family)